MNHPIQNSQSQSAEKLKFNPFSLAFHQNPYPTYDHLRTHDPLHWSFLQAWIVTRFADAEFVLKDPRFCVDDLPERLLEKGKLLTQGDFSVLSQTIAKWLFFLEPPDHTRLRGLVQQAFSPRAIKLMENKIQENVDVLLDRLIPQGQMDAIADFASPLPSMSVVSLLGVPDRDFDKLVRWSEELFFVFDQPMSLEGYRRQNDTAIEARNYLIDLIARKEKNPGDDLLSALIMARNEGTQLTQDEILGFCVMFFIVGQETTKSLIGNALVALIDRPQHFAELRDRPDIIKNAVEELLRYDTPVQFIARLATEDVELGGKTIRAGDKIIVCLGAANRDPEQFTNPNVIDFQRANRGLPFGSGAHFCLGAFLARLQVQRGLSTLAQRVSDLQFNTETLDWRQTITLRGLASLPVKFSPRLTHIKP